MEFEVVDSCPVPRELVDEVRALKRQTGATLNSCDRSPEAEPVLRRYGKLSQRQLYDGFVQGRPGFNPANPPGRSTHERRNDGAAYPGRAGALLDYWQVGMDWSNPQAVVEAASKRGWIVTVTYPTNAREAHHLNFRKEPELAVVLKPGSRGKRVEELTNRLRKLRSPKTGELYLDRKRRRYDDAVEEAVRAFQADYHQKVDGLFGPQSATQLQVALREQRQRERRLYRRRDHGIEVERMTRALAVLVDPDTGRPYVRTPGERFDRRVERALLRFQEEHGLGPDGVFGPKSRRTLYRELRRNEKRLARTRGGEG